MKYTANIFNTIQPITKGSVTASSPSNIALVKYWGKKENQIPANPSVSYTLSQCKTDTRMDFHLKPEQNNTIDVQVFFEEQYNESFTQKVKTFFNKITNICPYLYQYNIDIYTHNTFPHSSGIASSASGMSAIAIALVQMEKQLGAQYSPSETLKRASYLARLGSGSASRSVYNGLVLWGEHPDIPYSSNEIAQPLQSEIATVFRHFHDTIMIVHKGQKSVSSTQGHSLMYGHPFKDQRFQQAYENINKLQGILKSGDLDAFGELVESEALTLHAMMMTSLPYFILMQPNTLEIIQRIWKARKEQNIPVFFTLDAGANVHVLYPHHIEKEVKALIENELKSSCEDGLYIHDEIVF